MINRSYLIRVLILGLPLCAAASVSAAIFDSSLDDQADGAKAKASVPSTWSEPTTTVVEVTIPPATPNARAPSRTLSANPLWEMPLKQFSVTRERPIFLPSRRPPAPPASIVTVANFVVPKPKEPEQPQLSLVGTISGDDAKFGIFVDQATKNVLRLKVGEDFQGWQLRSVQAREASFAKNQLTFVVALPQPGLSQPSIAVREEARPPGTEDGKLLPVNARPRTR
jgi:general secretion pathway protein N